MTEDPERTRALLIEAFAREGIDYPADRLDEAVEDYSYLRAFMSLIRAELLKQQDRPN